MELADLVNNISHWLKIISPAIAGIWVFYKYFREGFHRPRIEFDITCNIIDSNQDDYLLELTLLANNKGNIRFTFTELMLRVRGIEQDTAIEFWGDTKRAEFPVALINENIIPPRFKYYFVEPGVTQPISFTTKIPKNIKYIVAYASFKYRHRFKIKLCPPAVIREKHTRERVFDLSKSI